MKRKFLSILLILVIAVGAFGPASAQDDDFVLKILNIAWGTPPPEDTDFELWLEEQMGFKIEVQWVPAGEWANTVNLLMASDDLPMITHVPEENNVLFSAPQVQAVEDGLFKDLTPWLDSEDFAENYPHLANIPQAIWDVYTFQGKMYAIPRNTEPWTFSGMHIRKDLFEKLGYTVPDDLPTTMDELTKILIEMTEEFDVYGFHMGRDSVDSEMTASLAEFSNAFVGVQGWGINEEGEFFYHAFMPEYLFFLDWMKTLYDAGAINPEFPLGQNGGDWPNGKSGLRMFRWHIWHPAGEDKDYNWVGGDPSEDAPEDLYWLLIPPVQGPSGAWTVDANDGGWTKSMISSKVSDEDVPKILKFINFISATGYEELTQYGPEGLGYYELDEDGNKVTTEKWEEDGVYAWNWFGHREWGAEAQDWIDILRDQHHTPEESLEWIGSVLDKIYEGYENSPGIRNLVYNLYSPTYVEYWSELTARRTEMATRYVFGEIGADEWTAYVEEITSDPLYQDIVDEFSEAYAEAMTSE